MEPLNLPLPLKKIFLSIDGRGYKAYKTLQGKSFEFKPFTVRFEHVQGDPFASPTRISVTVDLLVAEFRESDFDTPARRLALEDFLLRRVYNAVRGLREGVRGIGKSGEIGVQVPGQKILQRSSVLIHGNTLSLILFVGLPAAGRTILGKECARMFSDILPPIWKGSLLAKNLDLQRLERWVQTLEDYEALQTELEKNGWVAFIGNGSRLPRASGVSDRPLEVGGVDFEAPEGLSVSINLPHHGKITGMPVPKGITLIVGGGFHGKSTLLRAIQDAVYPHIPGDGRETAATVRSAVKVRAEDGRPVKNIDLSGFMDRLPLVESTKNFSTQNASGSTSQAVNILEAVESGAELLLMDEDTCATNFMIRDARMQALIASHREPITPLVDRIGEIYDNHGVSAVLVMGGSGDYFEAAHQVIAMENFEPEVVTEEAKRIVREHPGARKRETKFPFPPVRERRLDLHDLSFSRGKKESVIQTRGLITLTLGKTDVNTRYLEQLAEEGQLAMCGWIVHRLQALQRNSSGCNRELLRLVFEEMSAGDLTGIASFNTGLLTLPRIQEVLAVLNRIRWA